MGGRVFADARRSLAPAGMLSAFGSEEFYRHRRDGWRCGTPVATSSEGRGTRAHGCRNDGREPPAWDDSTLTNPSGSNAPRPRPASAIAQSRRHEVNSARPARLAQCDRVAVRCAQARALPADPLSPSTPAVLCRYVSATSERSDRARSSSLNSGRQMSKIPGSRAAGCSSSTPRARSGH